jgi:hypothetical protein
VTSPFRGVGDRTSVAHDLVTSGGDAEADVEGDVNGPGAAPDLVLVVLAILPAVTYLLHWLTGAIAGERAHGADGGPEVLAQGITGFYVCLGLIFRAVLRFYEQILGLGSRVGAIKGQAGGDSQD